MPRIKPINTDNTTDEQNALIQNVKEEIGRVPNILATMANSPATLKAYLGFAKSMSESSLSTSLREQISLAVSENNGCSYCLAAHTQMAKKAGLSSEDCLRARQGKATDSKDGVAVGFAVNVLVNRGSIIDDDIEEMRGSGYSDAQILEVVALVAMNVFTNTFNHVVETELDFPEAEKL